MENYQLHSMNTSQRQRTPVKLHNLSPEKYGKAAFDDNRCYTPSKLADNVLYREVTTMKKVQEGNGKVREYQALNSLLEERLAQAQQQKEGIEKTLNQQIAMYKKMLKDKQDKNQQRLRKIQNNFREQIRLLITEKEEESKYYQSETELLQAKILELQDVVNDLSMRLSNQGGAYNDLKNQKEKVQMQYQNLYEQSQKMETQKNKQIQKLQDRAKSISDEFRQAQNQWKVELQTTIHKKDTERQSIKQNLTNKISQLQDLRMGDNIKSQNQIQDLKAIIQNQNRKNEIMLDAQTKKNMQIVEIKQRMIERLSQQISQHKDSILELSRENTKLSNQVAESSQQNKMLAYQLRQYDVLNNKEKMGLITHIENLKEEIRLNQVNYVRQKDKNQMIFGENRKLQLETKSYDVMVQQIAKLRELLLESSHQIEACRERFISFERENKKLRYDADRLTAENDSLLRLRRQLEEQAVKWRQNYLRIAH